jgi:hypothetical protein
VCAVVASSVNQVDIEFLPKGLHDLGQLGMSARLREALAAVNETRYEAILLGYGLCSNGVVGLTARLVPLVLPRAHDCITLFLGSKERYLDYFHRHPGTYFKTSGWIERGEGLAQLNSGEAREQASSPWTYEAMAAKYGEDNARFLYEELRNMTRNYQRMTFIEMGIEPDERFEEHARRQAAERGWEFEKLAGDMALLRALVDGQWDEERFLVVSPGYRIVPSFDERIVRAEPAS